MKTITRLVLREFPHVCLDSHLFVLALVLVIGAAIFSIAARALSITMWYPLCILIIPAIIAYWTTRRRGLYFIKMSQVYFINFRCYYRFVTFVYTSPQLPPYAKYL